MEHGGELITTIALGLTAAFIGGFVARRIKLPSIVRYLLATRGRVRRGHARRVNQRIEIVVRVETPEEAKRLLDRGATQTVEGERELAVQMARYTLRRFAVTGREVEAIAQGLRRRPEPAGAV